MNTSSMAKTHGCHHIGLTVSKLEESAKFFTECLGWQEVSRDERYPTIFVSDAAITLALWPSQLLNAQFDKNHVGLHHLAFMVESEDMLDELYETIKQHSSKIELAPEQLADGPGKHMVCYDPSGIRIELIWPGPDK